MQTVPTASLKIHPHLSSFPAIDEHSPEVKIVVKAIGDLGRILDPLKVNRGRIVDGRVRHLAAQIHGMESVPVDEVDDSEVATIALQSLLARKHLTTGARTYLVEPLIEHALIETRKRAIEAAKTGLSASKSSPATGVFANTVEDLLEQFGISRSEFYRVKEIKKKFAASPKGLRERWEPRIISGEMSLEQVQQALSGKLAALNGQTTPKNDAYQLTLDLFKTAAVRLPRWAELDKDEKKEAKKQLSENFLGKLPDELLAFFAKDTARLLHEKRGPASA